MPATKRRQASKRHRARQGRKSHPRLTKPQILAAAARKWHVPLWVLYGVWGIESTFGEDPAAQHPNSAEAEGDFQFIPGTAAAYGVNVNSFASSANGAAHYLHDLKKERGSWAAAIEGYGGGYTAADVKAMAKKRGVTPRNSEKRRERALVKAAAANGAPISPKATTLPVGIFEKIFPGKLGEAIEPPPHPFSEGSAEIPNAGGSLLDFPGELLQSATAVTAIITTLLDIHFWIRVGMALGAFILLYMGLQALTGQGPSAGDVARRSAETATAVAAVK
jgi:hypothetical protein